MSRVNTCFVWKYYDLKVPCERSKNIGRFRVNKVSSPIVQQMENSTVTALTYSLRVSFFTDIFPLKEIQTISNITDNLNYVANQQNGNLFDGT